MIFITGSKGFVGRELIAQCIDQGIDYIGIDLPEFDIRSKDIVDFIPEGMDAVVHLAALSNDNVCKNKAYDCFESNVMATLNLMQAAEQKKSKQFIFASSEWVYDNCTDKDVKTEESLINIANHTSEYALSKLVSEANLRQKYQHGFCSTSILRFGIIYGPRTEGGSAVESLFRSVRDKEEIEVGSLATGRHFIHVSDIASGIIKSIGLDSLNVINLEGDNLITLGDIIETSKKILGKNPKIAEKDSLNASIRRVSNAKAKDVLKWKPEVNLEQGLKSLSGL